MGKGERVKTTVGLERSLWEKARIRAVQEGRDLQDVIADALTAYLRTPVVRKEGGR
jgi:hypothetical protein